MAGQKSSKPLSQDACVQTTLGSSSPISLEQRILLDAAMAETVLDTVEVTEVASDAPEDLLGAVSTEAQETQDGMIIEGRNKRAFETNEDTQIDSFGDHRLAMSSSIAALYATKPIEVLKTEFVQTSFPNFFELLDSIKE